MRKNGAPATKADLKRTEASLRQEIKSETKALDRKLSIEIINTHGRIDSLGNSLRTEIREGNSSILKAVDGFMSQVGKVDRHQIITDYRVDELDKRVKAIEASA